jgi:hypothetical protein
VAARAAGALAKLQNDMAALAAAKGAPPAGGFAGVRERALPTKKAPAPPPSPGSEWGREVARLGGGDSDEGEGEGAGACGGGHGEGWQQPGDVLGFSVEGYSPRWWAGAKRPSLLVARKQAGEEEEEEKGGEGGDGGAVSQQLESGEEIDEEDLFCPREMRKGPAPRGKPLPRVLFAPCAALPDVPDSEFL